MDKPIKDVLLLNRMSCRFNAKGMFVLFGRSKWTVVCYFVRPFGDLGFDRYAAGCSEGEMSPVLKKTIVDDDRVFG